MYRLNTLSKIACGVGLLVFCLPLSSSATVYSEKTIVHFNQPVEIPGQVLAPGTYVFRLASSLCDRDIVEIFNKNESQLDAKLLAQPVYRSAHTSKLAFTFEERAPGAPEAIHAWF